MDTLREYLHIIMKIKLGKEILIPAGIAAAAAIFAILKRKFSK